MFSPIRAADHIKDEFIGYISTLFHISDQDYAGQFAAALREEGAIAKGPYLDVSDSYRTGKSLAQLIEEGEASPLFRNLEGDIPDGDKEIQINRGLYLHQESALRKTNKGKNLIVTTGTGSGKTECFIIPIINHLLREAEEGTLSSGVRAILIYPMNALANDQMKRLRNLLKGYPEITFGVYNTGETTLLEFLCRNKEMTRELNTILFELGRVCVKSAIRQDAILILSEALSAGYTAAQVAEFIRLAQDCGNTQVTAILLEHQQNHFADLDPMAEFTLD